MKTFFKTIISLLFFLILFKKSNLLFYKFKLNNFFLYNNIPFIKTIYFNYDSYNFNNNFNTLLNQYIIFLRNNPNKQILFKLNTICFGNIKYNLFLNKYRLNFVVTKFVLKGINKKKIKYIVCVKKNKFYNESNTLNNNQLSITIM